ncbi:hypothetical protein EDD36DRAFT_44581 [Exophiala viscosa]|uniref:gamma-glutamylcyclotransferase n=1 Tax=Exophiala viscosa TaxID=2486360 RepID=A0AAN6E6S0_9EURO|nr:hypothetical protein EDD36DRAFT_44581 [Exophiala viscosa]
MAQEQVVYQPHTSSKTGTFYFAFGSNLSPYQMSIRLHNDPSSSVPIAIARLDSYAWIICERGYANVVPLPGSNAATDANTVWGVLYNMTPEDEARLDMYEGHNEARNPVPQLNPDPQTQHVKPYLQGDWDYNKHYLPMTVTKWLKDPNEYGVSVPGWSPDKHSGSDNTTVRALVYVDEDRVTPGEIAQEYIGRMNRAIDESVKLGVPQSWVDNILRKYIPPDISVDEDGYVGTDEGYVEAEATEAGDHVKEMTVKDGSWKGDSAW